MMGFGNQDDNNDGSISISIIKCVKSSVVFLFARLSPLLHLLALFLATHLNARRDNYYCLTL